MKTIIWDIVFIVGLAILLTILSETGNMNYLMKLPFITIYAAYLIGRFAGYLSKKEILH
jgi:Ca2+/H+ antiporter